MLLTCVHVASPDSHRAHVLSLYIFVTAAATPIGALLCCVVADWLNIDARLGGAGVLLMFGICAGLISVFRHHANTRPASVPERVKKQAGLAQPRPATHCQTRH